MQNPIPQTHPHQPYSISPPPPLPTSRAFLTSLITTLSTLSKPTNSHTSTNAQSQAQTQDFSQNHSTQNPQPQPQPQPQPLPDAARPLLTTLHVLFPHVLLDALDLLDRGLVTRELVNLKQDETNKDTVTVTITAGQGGPSLHAPGTSVTSKPAEASARRSATTHIYTYPTYYVQSAQITPIARHQHQQHQHTQYPTYNDKHEPAPVSAPAPLASNQVYQVNLTAWNCSCPAFAFSCYSNSDNRPSARTDGDEYKGVQGGGAMEQDDDGCEAGARDGAQEDQEEEEEGVRAPGERTRGNKGDTNNQPKANVVQTDGETQAVRAAWENRIFYTSPPPPPSPSPSYQEQEQQQPHNHNSRPPFQFCGLSLPFTQSYFYPSNQEASTIASAQAEAQVQAQPIPICKHILACVLAEECEGFFGVVRDGGDGEGNGSERRGQQGQGQMVRGVVGRMVGMEGRAGFAAGGG